MRIPKKPFFGRGTIQEASLKKSRERAEKRRKKKIEEAKEKAQDETKGE
jgi:hypothetical protein